MVNFIIRLVGYGLLLGVSSRIGQTLWTNYGLDGNAALHAFHDSGVTLLLVAPVVLALLGIGILRAVCVFVGCGLAGAAITAPFVIARITGV
jgi:hypothetical protein